MVKHAIVRRAVPGLDVGKSAHWACLVTREFEIVANRPVPNSEQELDELFAQVGPGTLVVVDQVRNIGALAIRRARCVLSTLSYDFEHDFPSGTVTNIFRIPPRKDLANPPSRFRA